MELKFEKRGISCMEACVREFQNGEETLEIRLPDGMPDIGRIVASWGQPILRSKEWRKEQLSFSGGMMVWVLYQPEQGGAVQCLEGWIPFAMSWDLPKETKDGDLRIDLRCRFVDARATSARKVMIRGGLSAEAEGWVKREVEVFEPGKLPEQLQLLRKKYPLRMVKEAGEKAFQLSEKLTLPPSVPKPDKLFSYMFTPVVTEKKMVGDKLVFRGSGELHFLYAAEDGQLYTWDMPIGFSQYTQLDDTYGSTGMGELVLCTTALEAELDDEGVLEVKCAVTAQYLVTDQELVEVVTDAYAPGRTVQVEKRQGSFPVILDSWQETVEAERSFSGQADISVESWVSVDSPRQRPLDDHIQLELPGHLQLLYHGPDGEPGSMSGRFDGKLSVKADPGCTLKVQPLTIPEPMVDLGADHVDVRMQIPVQITAMGDTELEMICSVALGEQRTAQAEGPSLIVKRVGKDGLWELAKASDSTVDAIREANGLEADPVPGRMLLIPVS